MKLILTGGFLGSGKTTAIAKACDRFISEGKRVAVITNDQGDQQVDTAFMKSLGIPSREVINGCFCCNYNQLDEHITALQDTVAPEFLFAEAVGSCADIVATIAGPLSRFRSEIDVIVSIFIDAEFLTAILENRSCFIEESVRYIYKKQLDEGDMLVINKADLLSPEQLYRIKNVLQNEYPSKLIITQDSLNEGNVLSWLEAIQKFRARKNRKCIEMDYDIYAKGEAALAWMDRSIEIVSHTDNAVFIAKKIMGLLFNHIQEKRITIGHLKFFLETETTNEKISFTSTSTSSSIQISVPESTRVRLLINARVQSQPEVITSLIDQILVFAEDKYSCAIIKEKSASFTPGYPTPTHRFSFAN